MGEENEEPMIFPIGKKLNKDDIRKITLQKIIQSNKGYIELCNQSIEEINKCDPKDRLEYALSILIIVSVMNGSIQGWAKWCNLKPMNDIKMEEFKEIFPRMKELAKEWITIDKEITKTKVEELEEELRNIDKESSTKKRKDLHQPYVA